MNLQIQDTGLGKTDPYVITENGEVLAQSYPNENGEHFQTGLREIVDEITTLRAQLAEAVSLIAEAKVEVGFSNALTDKPMKSSMAMYEKLVTYLQKVTPA